MDALDAYAKTQTKEGDEVIRNMNAVDFIAESNRIEGITRAPTGAEIDEFNRFMALDRITIEDLVKFVNVYQPGAVLRDKKGLDVRVGSYFPPKGSGTIRRKLNDILDDIHLTSEGAYITHQLYEKLHPFTDGNGRSGRMLWRWQMRYAPLGFLHHWYYQSLQYGGGR